MPLMMNRVSWLGRGFLAAAVLSGMVALGGSEAHATFLIQTSTDGST